MYILLNVQYLIFISASFLRSCKIVILVQIHYHILSRLQVWLYFSQLSNLFVCCLKWSLVNFLYLQLLTGHNHAGIQESGPHLLIQNAMMSHEGQYTCVVTNSAGEDKKDFRITVQGGLSLVNHIHRIVYLAKFCWKTNTQKKKRKIGLEKENRSPVIAVPPVFHRVNNREAAWGLGHEGDDKDDMVEKVEVVLSHPITLSCESNAIPPPKLSWYKDGQKLTSSDGVKILSGNTASPTPCVALCRRNRQSECGAGSNAVVSNCFPRGRRTSAADCSSAERRCGTIQMSSC